MRMDDLEICAVGSNADDPIISWALIVLPCDTASPTVFLFFYFAVCSG